jgi:PAS domain S-box-containing protein
MVMERLIEEFDSELDYLFASLRRLGARPEEIEDLAHQVFLGLLRARPRFSERASFRLHLFGLALRVIVKHRRRTRGNTGDATNYLPLSLKTLDRLPLKRRAVLVLHELDQLPLAEIAASLSMSRLGVALRLRKARREAEGAIRQLAADWRAGRFGRPDLLLEALGIRATEKERRSDLGGEIFQLQDDIFLLEMVMDDLPETIYFKDRQSRFTHINRYAAAHYGIGDPTQAIGRTDFDFFTDKHAVEALRDEQQIIETGRALVSIEEQETLPDGRHRWVWTTKLPLPDRRGDIVGTFGLSRDITERRAAR